VEGAAALKKEKSGRGGESGSPKKREKSDGALKKNRYKRGS